MTEELQRAIDALQKLPKEQQNIIAGRILEEIAKQENLSKIPLDEGMKSYHKIKERYDGLFRELAKL